jgi:catechol 2,3-dioxygenase-like lactoylglutathione lyase family enzyme
MSASDIKFRIRHTMLPVADMDRTIDFYTRLLGMDIMRIREEPEKKLRTFYLGYGSEDDGPALELIQTGAADASAKMPPQVGPRRALRLRPLQARRDFESGRREIYHGAAAE